MTSITTLMLYLFLFLIASAFVGAFFIFVLNKISDFIDFWED
jgi:hypothetical protein